MDPLLAIRQQFARHFGHAPSDSELGDFLLATAIMMHADTLTPPQIVSRATQMLTPGTPLNAFLRRWK